MNWLRAAIVLAAVATGSQARGFDVSSRAPAESELRSILREEAYPWYDADRDAVRPVMDDPSSWHRRLAKAIGRFFDWLSGLFPRQADTTQEGAGRGLGTGLPSLMMLSAGALFVVLLWRLWRLHDPAEKRSEGQARIGDAARVAGLPQGSSLKGVDPWQEALRRRADDPAGAIIWLFLDQLLALEHAGILRLSPGRTARQYSQAIEDKTLASGLQATLGAFEDVYYGRRLPSPRTLDEVWARAAAFRRRIEEIRGT